MAFIDDIKPYFETNDLPTQAQFYAMLERLRWKDEALNITDVTGLQAILNALATPVEAFTVVGTHTYTIPAGHRLEALIMKPVSNCTVRCDTAGALEPGDVLIDLDITAAGADVSVNKMAFVSTDVIVYGLPAGSKIYFVKRKIY
jgi:hypothetical protein